MATARSQGAACRIVQDRILTLNTEDRHGPDYRPHYEGIVVMEDKILVVDILACNLQVYNRLDGRWIFTSDKMEGQPRGVCVLSDTEFAVCLSSGKIVIMSLDSMDVVKQVKTFEVRAGFGFSCQSVAKWRSDELIVSGRKSHDMLFWGFVSVKDESFVTTHDICKGDSLTHVAVKHNTVYISCRTGDAITAGVYAFDVLNLNHKPKFLYQHEDLKSPWSIIADRDYVFVCSRSSKSIHQLFVRDFKSDSIYQLSDTGHLLAIHRTSSRITGMFYDGDLYTTSYFSNLVSVYTIQYQPPIGVPIEILKMHERSIQLFQEALKDGDKTVHSIHVMVVGSIGTGKSTLIKRLIGGEVNMSKRHTTEAIDVHCCDVSLSTGTWKRQTKGFHWETIGKHACLTIWDIPGQRAFYASHRAILSRRAIFLLVFDVSYYTDMPGKVHELVDVWLNSIHSCTSSQEDVIPSVILVGTHVDKISQDKRHEICKRYFGEIRSYLEDKPTRFHLIDEDFTIDNTVVDSSMEDLRRKIVEVASQQPYWGEKIPARWLPLQQELMRQKTNGVKVISHDDVIKINKNGAVQLEPEELDLFLMFLHETGVIIYGSIEKSKGNIVLDPTWINDALNSLINIQSDLTNLLSHIDTRSSSLADSVITDKLPDFKDKGILSPDLIDAVWTAEKYPELHAHKEQMLEKMEELNIIARPRAFNEIGETKMNYFLTPSMLRQESPREITLPEEDPLIVSTPTLCLVFKRKFLPLSIFHKLIAACVARWPISKKKETSENLIFSGCSIFDLGLFHRLTLHCENHVVYARIMKSVVDEVKIPDSKLCSRVRKFITMNLTKIIADHAQNLQYELCSWWSPSHVLSEDGSAAPFEMWFVDEGHDSDSPISPEHMNHARLNVALVTVCADALREIFLSHAPAPHRNIYQAILANRAILTNRTKNSQGQWQNPLLLPDQSQVVFIGKSGQYVATVDNFDISLLYVLIRNVSAVSASLTDWGSDPIESPKRDKSLGASVDRIRIYRNKINHSQDGKISKDDFDAYWEKIESVLDDIEKKLGRGEYKAKLEEQRRQVISVYEAC